MYDSKTSIEKFLLEHAAADTVALHMPGHKGSALYRETGHGEFLDHMVDCDITEIPGADDLFDTRGVIKTAQERYAELYGVQRSYLQVNGTSGGLIACILATVPRGGSLVVARNSHKSVFNALALGGIRPVYVEPDIWDRYGICGPVSPSAVEEALEENREASGVIITSPNYYGILSDIGAIAKVCHDRGKVLIVDQAHGAHLAFFDEEEDTARSAERGGADLVVGSIHKTLAGFTQSAILNVNSDRVDQALLQDKLQTIESSSPSYLLMASLEISADILENHRHRMIPAWRDRLNAFYDAAAGIPDLDVMRGGPLDETKINAGFSGRLTGARLAERLEHEYGIFVELHTGDMIMGMTGLGTSDRDLCRLRDALTEIAKNLPAPRREEGAEPVVGQVRENLGIPARREQVPLSESAGRVCAVPVIPYPPGIPLVCPGEVITEEDVAFIAAMKARHESVIGLTEQGGVFVGAEE